MNTILLNTFITLYILMVLTKLVLIHLNMRSVVSHGVKIPDELAGNITKEELQKANSYSLTNLKFEKIEYFIDRLLLYVFLMSGLLAWYTGLFENYGLISGGLLFFGGLFITSFIIQMPFNLYEQFVIEEKFGFNTSNLKTWTLDQIKGIIISVILGGILLLGILFFISKLPNIWWLLAWLLSLAISLFSAFIYPNVIAPMFNKFTPIEGELADGIRALAIKSGLKVKEIFEMDASKRTKKTNAYFAGFGKTKRIVLFDTLIKAHTKEEILAVLAHEMGHWKHKHVLKRIIVSQLLQIITFYLAYLFINSSTIFEIFGIDGKPLFAGLLILMIFFEIPMFFLSPLFNALSRKHEREADSFAIKLTGNKDDLSNALKKLVNKNLSNLHPHPLYSLFFYSHPPVLERLKTIKNNIIQ